MERFENNRREIINILMDKDESEITEMVSTYTTLMTYYKCAILETETKFRVLDAQFSSRHERNPIESITTRLKSFPSIKNKLEKDGLKISVENLTEHLNDIAGVRVICAFVDDIYMLADCLISQDDVRLIKMKDFIKEPKENGYRSLHLIIELPIFLYNEKRFVKVEVQLRTIAMESWANLEHRLRYKKDLDEKKLLLTSDMLTECADISMRLDTMMQSVRNIIDGE